MKILCIDPGKNSMGLYFKNQDDNSYKSETINNNNLKTTIDKYRNIYNRLSWYMDILAPSFVIIEDYIYFKNMKMKSRSITSLGEVRGIVYTLCIKYDIPMIIMPVQTWQQYLSNHPPKKQKKKYLDFFNNRFNKTFDSIDSLDAYLIYRAVRNIQQKRFYSDPAEEIYNQIGALND